MPPPSSSPALHQPGVRIVNPLEIPSWDATLQNFPAATFFHRASWARVLHSTYGYEPLYFVQEEEGRVRSILPLMEVKSWLTGKRGVSLPFTDALAPLCANAASFRCLFNAALQQVEFRSWKYLECRGGREWCEEAPVSTAFLNHHLDLSSGETKLFEGCDTAVRRAVRKAERSALTWEFSQDLDAMQTFHRLLCITRQRHGVPPQPFPFFKNIHRHIMAENQGWVVLARLGKTAIAGAIFLHLGGKIIYKFGASDESFQHLRANNLVMWKSIQSFAKQGFTSLDFGRSSLGNEGLRRFKLGWGATESRIEYFRYDRHTMGYVVAQDHSAGWQNRLFSKLPVVLSRPIGAILYPHLG